MVMVMVRETGLEEDGGVREVETVGLEVVVGDLIEIDGFWRGGLSVMLEGRLRSLSLRLWRPWY